MADNGHPYVKLIRWFRWKDGRLRGFLRSLNIVARLAEAERLIDLLDDQCARLEASLWALDEATPGWDDICRIQHSIDADEIDRLRRELDDAKFWSAHRNHSHAEAH
jgi:hypothetical protein